MSQEHQLRCTAMSLPIQAMLCGLLLTDQRVIRRILAARAGLRLTLWYSKREVKAYLHDIILDDLGASCHVA
jgi:hypothetical protein